MYKDFRYINAGENEFYRWGKKAVAKAQAALVPNENGFYSIPADGGKYWTIGTSKGKFGDFARFGDKILSVNKAGFVWAKAGTDKEEVFKAMVNRMISDMMEKRSESTEEGEE